jgi:hypothetical protein
MAISSAEMLQRTLYRNGIEALLRRTDLGFELFVTLNFNRPTTFNGARHLLGEWAQRVDEAYIGKQWSDNSARRLFFIAVFENQDTNPHFHLVVRLPLLCWRRLSLPKFEQYRTLQWHTSKLEYLWVRLVCSGNCYTEPIYNLNGLARYNSKQFLRSGYAETFIISSEFHMA